MQTFVRLPNPAVPKEQQGNVVYGTFLHLGSPFFYVVILALVGVNMGSAIWAFLAVSLVFMPMTLIAEKYQASVELPKPTGKEFFDGLVMVFITGILIGGSVVTTGWWLLSHVPLYEAVSNSWWKIAAATVGTDFAYYLIHRFLSHGKNSTPMTKYYRRKHAYHHAVTALDFLRGNQSSVMDTAFTQFQPSLIVLSWLLGMDLPSTWVAYGLILLLQATDHTSVTYNIGWLRYIFMDNHAHKFHHCKRGNLVNHAAAFSVFDRLFGTYYEEWDISSNYLHHHKIPLPIREKSEGNA
jgi:sterol desaturase/sphingolipid hydroxylase (fatty acid hydroxylase superfamily)